ncbi:FAD-binding oxidoreductase [Leifsonia sp. H3M29-4]|uniref:FAD-binding oxidoreductase n=1 Tax=Salinibacterium metalliresistens TaxID=3031321 RepID=UPI0023DCB22D|nr:FAD-binding oxidoreductase [Salinibacterium metalliresistens]MDF1479318.1 FAD-binding oxidoreductase [Salinibacterium metalliresistens]
MNTASIAAVSPAVIESLIEAVGNEQVELDPATRAKASRDDYTMSPILVNDLPATVADVVVYPRDADDVVAVMRIAVRERVAVTPRGKGTGNYGQAVPLAAGIVLDFTRMDRVLELGEGSVTAQAGARVIDLERKAALDGQQLWMYPSTVQSTIGGFIGGGSGGTGSIANGSNAAGFVVALDVVHAVDEPRVLHIEGDEVIPYIHAYGLTGVIVAATVRLEPLQDWRALYASFDRLEDAFELVREVPKLVPPPRLVSADEAGMNVAFPKDDAVPAGRASFRAILDARTVEEVSARVAAAGGRVEAVREGIPAMARMSGLSYNHPSWFLIHSNPGGWFHIESGGEALIDRFEEVKAVYPGALIHLEGNRPETHGMITAPFSSKQETMAGLDALDALGVGFHNPHQWYIDRNVDALRALAATSDPYGLLNPGHWPGPDAPISSNFAQQARRALMEGVTVGAPEAH